MDVSKNKLAEANKLRDQGNADLARKMCLEIIEHSPADIQALTLLSTIEIEDGNDAAAADIATRILQIDPDCAAAHYNLGLVRHRAGAMSEAFDAYQKAATLDPDHKEALYNVAFLLRLAGRFDEAIAVFRRVVSSHAEWDHAWHALIETSIAQGNLDGALSAADVAVKKWPKSSTAWRLRADALRRKLSLDAAAENYRMSLEFEPENVLALHNLGGTYQLLDRFDEAIKCYEQEHKVFVAGGGDPLSHSNLLSELIRVRRQIGDLKSLGSLEAFALERLLTNRAASIDPKLALNLTDDPASLHLAAQRAWPPASPPIQLSSNRVSAKIRLGYLSASVRDDAGSRLLASLLQHHDRDRFEVFAYSVGPNDFSETRMRLERSCDRFLDASAFTDLQATARIANDRIDVLVDLMGHSFGSRLPIIAKRPARIVVSYGYPGTLGMKAIDYLIADDFVIPPEEEEHYGEAIVKLPGPCHVHDARHSFAGARSQRGEVGLKDEWFVYCAFGRAVQLGSEHFASFMNILKDSPAGVLWLLEENSFMRDNLRSEAERQGVDPGRLIFAERRDEAGHRKRLSCADLFLDSWPNSATTDAVDAVSAGLPVLTRPGRSFASRLGGSMLRAVGLPELIAGDAEEFRHKAVDLAKNRDALRALRSAVERDRGQSLLFDIQRFRRHLESAFERMMSAHSGGKEPRGFSVAPNAH